MQLNTFSTPAKVQLAGQGSYAVVAGQTLKIETSPQGEDILEASPPAGKKWTVSIKVNVEESDV